MPYRQYYDTRFTDVLMEYLDQITTRLLKGEDTRAAVTNLEFYFTFWKETLIENAGTAYHDLKFSPSIHISFSRFSDSNRSAKYSNLFFIGKALIE